MNRQQRRQMEREEKKKKKYSYYKKLPDEVNKSNKIIENFTGEDKTLNALCDCNNIIDLGETTVKNKISINNYVFNWNVYEILSYMFQDNTIIKSHIDKYNIILGLIITGEDIRQDYAINIEITEKNVDDKVLLQFIIDCNHDDSFKKIFKVASKFVSENSWKLRNISSILLSSLINTFTCLEKLMTDDDSALRLNIIRERKFVSNKINECNPEKAKKYLKTNTSIKIDGVKFSYTYLDLPQRTYNRYTKGWKVRGHFRRYKDGRTVYIKPYIKGTISDIEDKTYKIC